LKAPCLNLGIDSDVHTSCSLDKPEGGGFHYYDYLFIFLNHHLSALAQLSWYHPEPCPSVTITSPEGRYVLSGWP